MKVHYGKIRSLSFLFMFLNVINLYYMFFTLINSNIFTFFSFSMKLEKLYNYLYGKHRTSERDYTEKINK